MPQAPDDRRDFSSFVAIVAALRGPDGCPWNRQQNHQSLTRYAIEEAHELVQAIDGGRAEDIRDELGDALLQVVLHAEIAKQAGEFDIHDVIETISEKMIRRHPHVFAKQPVASADEVVANWQQIKDQERAQKAKTPGFSLPVALPALIVSHKIGEKTKTFGFDWPDTQGVLRKLEEELSELKEALQSGSSQEQLAELGDVLFSLAQLARHLNSDGELCLRQCNQRFEKRFFHMLQLIEASGQSPQQLSAQELEVFWQKAKKELRKRDSSQ